MTNFGNSFKKAREHRGLSYAQIADETRISTRFLEAIENEDFQLLPGGIFNRGFIRTYATRIGLDPDAAIKEYEQLLKSQQPEQTVVATVAETPTDSGTQKNFYPVAIVALLVAIVIFYIFTREPAKPLPVARQPGAVAATPQAEEVSPPSLTSSVAAASEPEPIPAPTSAITLDIQATDSTWIKVNADGTNVTPGEILKPGDTRHFNADTSLNLIVGNAGGLNLKLNDQAMKPIGKSGQVREIKVTPENLNDFLE